MPVGDGSQVQICVDVLLIGKHAHEDVGMAHAVGLNSRRNGSTPSLGCLGKLL